MALLSDWSDKAGGSATRGRLRTDFWLGVVYRLHKHCDENGNCSSCGRPGPPNTWPQDKPHSSSNLHQPSSKPLLMRAKTGIDPKRIESQRVAGVARPCPRLAAELHLVGRMDNLGK
jgi:hypothetical protein